MRRRYRILAGPETVVAERDGIRSKPVHIGAAGTDELKAAAEQAYREDTARLWAWERWRRNRERMAGRRALLSLFGHLDPYTAASVVVRNLNGTQVLNLVAGYVPYSGRTIRSAGNDGTA